MKDDRRRADRKPHKERLNCYLDGDRLDMDSEDLSSTGMFLASEGQLLPGQRLAVVFRSPDMPAVYLLGSVVRRQLNPTNGVGLNWERAVTKGSVEVLHRFLKDRLKVRASSIQVRPYGPLGQDHAIYRFPVVAELAVQEAEAADPSVAPAPPLGPELSPLPQADVSGSQDFLKPGPLTHSVEEDSIAPAGIPGIMELGDQSVEVKIDGFGVRRLRVHTSLIPFHKDAKVRIRCQIVSKRGILPVCCLCQVHSVEEADDRRTASLLLTIQGVNEGGESGLLQRYVRWLHVRAMERD